MPNTPCLYGPPFSLVGEMYFIDDQVDFYVSIDSSAQQNTIKAHEWYLDQSLILENNTSAFRAKVTEGNHIVGVRILTADGWSGIKTFSFNTYKFPVSLNIYGVDTLDEGGTTEYRVIRVFSDQTTEDVTDEYTLWSTGGCFDGNIFTARVDPDSDENVKITINASKNSDVAKEVTIINSTGPVLESIEIKGLSVINEGTSTSYAVIGIYSDGTERDISSKYVLQSSEGNFVGQTYYAPTNSQVNDDRQVTITAVQNGAIKATSVITIKDVNSKPGVLVVDFLNSPPMNVIGFVDNAEIAISSDPAYTHKNTVPDYGEVSQAYVLASDFISEGPVKWRFQFNIAKLIKEYPQSENLVFHIKGRANQATGLYGAYGLKTHDTQMITRGSAGSLVPSVSGGSNFGSIGNFSTNAVSGANGDFTEQVLSTIIRFNYNVPNDILTYSLSSLDYLSEEIQEEVQKNDCSQDLEGSWVIYTLPGGAFRSSISEVDANNQAIAYFESNKQQYANDNGTCGTQTYFLFTNTERFDDTRDYACKSSYNENIALYSLRRDRTPQIGDRIYVRDDYGSYMPYQIFDQKPFISYLQGHSRIWVETDSEGFVINKGDCTISTNARISIVAPTPQTGNTNQFGFQLNIDTPITTDLTVEFSGTYESATGQGFQYYTRTLTLPGGAVTIGEDPNYSINATPASSEPTVTIVRATPANGSTVTSELDGSRLSLFIEEHN